MFAVDVGDAKHSHDVINANAIEFHSSKS